MPVTIPSLASERTAPAPLTLRFGFWFCVAIAVAVVIRRIVALTGSPRPSTTPMAGLDLAFAEHAALTFAHIIPALIFVLLAPIAMLRKGPRFAWAPALLYPVGAVVGLTAYAMSAYSIGGWLERSAVLVFNSWFLFSLWQAWRFHLENAVSERRWLLRAVVVLLGIATTRPVMGVFFATSRLTHLEPQQFFGMAFWIGFSINTVVVEFWLRRRNRTEPTPQRQAT